MMYGKCYLNFLSKFEIMKQKKNFNSKAARFLGQFLAQFSQAQRVEQTLKKLKLLLTGPSGGERVCIRGSEYILFEILD